MISKRKLRPIPPGEFRQFDRPQAALTYLKHLYDTNVQALMERYRDFLIGQNPDTPLSVYYPYVEIKAETTDRINPSLAYGFVARPGSYRATLTQPDLFADYYLEQFSLLTGNHGTRLEVGVSDQSIPIHFAFKDNWPSEAQITPERAESMHRLFDLPDLETMDDCIVNNTYVPKPGRPRPLALFNAARVDFSLLRLKHYTATSIQHFQHFVLFTNYQFYVDDFIRIGREMMTATDDPKTAAYRKGYSAFVEPGNRIISNANLGDGETTGTLAQRIPQMPAYHLKRPDGNGITLVNIGVGPSNAKTITDHIAVLRPHAWLMLGHCGGLRGSQRLGDYVLAHAYVREDHVLDHDLPISVPIPALSEIQLALEAAVSEVTGLTGPDLKRIMRTGTVATIDDRNWELR
ncbi:MAG: AMP nucleosidase, partial [Pseudomonadota bacterium]|nr:AMP nucleosidase [Pseudomonadota bacterium]